MDLIVSPGLESLQGSQSGFHCHALCERSESGGPTGAVRLGAFTGRRPPCTASYLRAFTDWRNLVHRRLFARHFALLGGCSFVLMCFHCCVHSRTLSAQQARV